MTMEQRRRHTVRKSLKISEKQTAKKHEAAQMYLFQMSDIQWGQHKKQQRTASRKKLAAKRERRNIYVGAPDQPHVRCGNKNKLEEANRLVNQKRGVDKELIHEGRNTNAGFDDLLVLANSAELLATQDATHTIGNAHAKKDVSHDVDKVVDATCRIGNVQAEKDAARVKGRIRRTHFRHQARLESPLPVQENHVSEQHERADLKRVKDKNIADIVKGDQVGEAICVQDVPEIGGQGSLLDEFYHHQAMPSNSTTKYVRRNQDGFCGPPAPRKVSWANEDPGLCVVTERGSKGLKGVRKQASLVESALVNTEELQPIVEPRNITPQAVTTTADSGDSMDQSDAHLRRKGRTGKVCGPLNKNYCNHPQEYGTAPPNCETVASQIQMSDAVKGRDLVAHGSGKLNQAYLVEVGLTNSKKLQPCVEPQKRIPQAVKMTVYIGDSRGRNDAHLLRKDRPGNMNGPLIENFPNPPQEDGHAPPNCETEPSQIQMSYAVKGCDPVAHGRGKWKVPSLVEAMTNIGELQPYLELHKITPQAVRMTADSGDSRDQSDAHLRRKARTGKIYGPLNKNCRNHPQEDGNASPNCETEPSPIQMSDVAKGRDPVACNPLKENNSSSQEHGHAPPICQTEPSLPQNSDAVKGRDPVSESLKHGSYLGQKAIQISEVPKGPKKRDYTNRRKKLPLAIQLAALLKEGPSVARQKRILRTSERRKQRSKNPRPLIQDNHIRERHDCVNPQKFEESGFLDVVVQLAEDRTAGVNGLLQENNLKSQRESGDAPLNCETEPSCLHLSEPLEGHDSVSPDGVKQKRTSVSQTPESLIACHIQMPNSVDQGTPPSQKTCGSDKHQNSDGKNFEDTRCDESVEAQQVQVAMRLQDTQEVSVIAERESNGIADIRKQASMTDPMKVTNNNSVPSVKTDRIISHPVQTSAELGDITVRNDARHLTEDTTAKVDGQSKANNHSTQHGCGHVSLNCENIPLVILTIDGQHLLSDANTGKSKEVGKDVQDSFVVLTRGSIEKQDKEKQASVIMPTKLIPIRKEKRRYPEDEDFAILQGRPKCAEIDQLPETLKDGVSIARHKRMLRTLERRKQRYGGAPFRASTDLHWSQTYNDNQRWMWQLSNSQNSEQTHIPKHQEPTIYTPYPAQEKQSGVAAQETPWRKDSLMAIAHEKQLQKLEEQRAAHEKQLQKLKKERAASELLHQQTNNNTQHQSSPDIATCAEQDSVAVELNQNVSAQESQSVPSALGEQSVDSAQPMEPTNCNPDMATSAEKELISEVSDQDGELQQQSTNEETTCVERKSQLPRLKHEARQNSANIVKETGKIFPRQKDKAAENKPRRRSSRLLQLQQQSLNTM